MRIFFISLAIATLSACGFVGFPGVYKINVEQGNIVTPEMAAQLKPGMTRRQVKFILGTPLVEDTFDRNRWDYLYSKRNGNKILSESRLTVVFDGDHLANVSGDLAPSDWNAGSSAEQPAAEPAQAYEPAPGIPAP
ncbi:Outer membrane protein assembly factor BamE [Halioglobus japonicus]|nr:Outer membrane protein assembly factor BamE [Halioglobus japonicus]